MSLDKRKTDPALGEKINAFLIKKKVETPVINVYRIPERKVEVITKKFTEILKMLRLRSVR